MSNTPNTGIPEVPEGVLDNAASINLGLRTIDALLQTKVIDMYRPGPPGSPADGDLHIVAGLGDTATGAWAGHELALARYVSDGAFWQFFEAGVNVHIVYNEDDGGLYAYSTGSPSGWFLVAGLGDAPSDSQQYVRQDGNWVASNLNPQPLSLKEWRAQASGALVPLGCNSPTVVGTESSQTGASASAGVYQTYINRRVSASTTAANNVASYRNSTAGDHVYGASAGAAKAAGFTLLMFGGVTTILSGERFFMGLAPSAATAGTSDPSDLTNCFGIGKDGSDTNLQFIHNDGSGTATKASLGFALAANMFFKLEISVPIGGGTWSYRLTDMDSGTVYTGSASSDVPAADTALYWKIWASTGGTGGTAAGVVLSNVSQRYPL